MKKIPILTLVWSLMLALAVTSCATVTTSGQQTATPPGAIAGAPIVTEAYASSSMYPGDTWRVYLKASDPSGEMKYIVSEVAQPGFGEYPVSYTKVKPENAKELNGYIYLNTIGAEDFLNFQSLYLTVQIKDRAGHYSRPVQFALNFEPRATQQQPPPPGEFQNNDLGPIMVKLSPSQTDGHRINN